MSLPQMPDVAGQSKEAAEKAAKAAKEAADLAAAKTKETYDLLIPAQIDWFEPINDKSSPHSEGRAYPGRTLVAGAPPTCSLSVSGSVQARVRWSVSSD